MSRVDGRRDEQLRPVTITTWVQKDPPGSVQVSCGDTVVLCAATVAERVPEWISSSGREHGWVTAEYAMLPGSTPGRVGRQRRGRWEEIQRLVGRSLRAAVDLRLLGQRTITIDCDVLQADGGTRTAAVTGGWVALVLALRRLREQGLLEDDPLRRGICAVSCALLEDDRVVLDPCYPEDASARVDANFVLDGQRRLVEVQATAEGEPFANEVLERMLELAAAGAVRLLGEQRRALEH